MSWVNAYASILTHCFRNLGGDSSVSEVRTYVGGNGIRMPDNQVINSAWDPKWTLKSPRREGEVREGRRKNFFHAYFFSVFLMLLLPNPIRHCVQARNVLNA